MLLIQESRPRGERPTSSPVCLLWLANNRDDLGTIQEHADDIVEGLLTDVDTGEERQLRLALGTFSYLPDVRKISLH